MFYSQYFSLNGSWLYKCALFVKCFTYLYILVKHDYLFVKLFLIIKDNIIKDSLRD
ncbi:MAG: hypothetical protein JWQ54_5310 [Mucilaginibacter sp.]|nr:hypothetical protein [Mucilaginibacter sp.]